MCQRRSRSLLFASLLGALSLVLLSGCNYSFLVATVQGRTVRWESCSVVHYRINPARLRVAQRQAVVGAMNAASRATGIGVHYDGHTTARPGTPPVGVVTVYARPFDDPPVASQGYTETHRTGDRIDGGMILFNTLIPMSDARTRDVVWHEVGHLFGLNHVSDGNQVMGGHASPYQSGDLEGLAAVGRRNGCG